MVAWTSVAFACCHLVRVSGALRTAESCATVRVRVVSAESCATVRIRVVWAESCATVGDEVGGKQPAGSSLSYL
eukprot:scaffold17288_cov66-Phaeocystis_antarctica.AAC.3